MDSRLPIVCQVQVLFGKMGYQPGRSAQWVHYKVNVKERRSEPFGNLFVLDLKVVFG